MKEIKKLDLEFNESLKPLENHKKIIIHHTHNPNLTTLTTHNMHIERFKWAGIGYNYFIENNGEIYEGRGDFVGAHALNNNVDSIGIAMSGNFDENLPTKEQYESLLYLTLKFMSQYDIEPSKVLGHREIEGVKKSCPGDNFDMNKFREDIIKIL